MVGSGGLFWAVVVCTRIYCVVLGCGGLQWGAEAVLSSVFFVLGFTALYRAVVDCTGL